MYVHASYFSSYFSKYGLGVEGQQAVGLNNVTVLVGLQANTRNGDHLGKKNNHSNLVLIPPFLCGITIDHHHHPTKTVCSQ